MKYLYFAWIVCVVTLAVSYCTKASGAEYRLLEPTELVMRWEQYESLRDPYMRQYDDAWAYGASMGVSLDILSGTNAGVQWRLYYDPTFMLRSTASQVRMGGLEYQMGAAFTLDKYTINFFRYHESLHCLECNADTFDGGSTSRHFPNVDSYGAEIRWRIKK